MVVCLFCSWKMKWRFTLNFMEITAGKLESGVLFHLFMKQTPAKQGVKYVWYVWRSLEKN